MPDARKGTFVRSFYRFDPDGIQWLGNKPGGEIERDLMAGVTQFFEDPTVDGFFHALKFLKAGEIVRYRSFKVGQVVVSLLEFPLALKGLTKIRGDRD